MSELVKFEKIEGIKDNDFKLEGGKLVLNDKNVMLSVWDSKLKVEYLAKVHHIDTDSRTGRHELCADYSYIFTVLNSDGSPVNKDETVRRINSWLPVHSKLPSDLKKETLDSHTVLKTLQDGEFVVFELKDNQKGGSDWSPFFYIIINKLTRDTLEIILDEVASLNDKDLDKYYGLYRQSVFINNLAVNQNQIGS